MNISVLTLFPELFKLYLSQTIHTRAKEKNLVNYDIVNIRDYSKDKHNKVDDVPYGGGAGMVLMAQPFFSYFYDIKKQNRKPYTIYLSAQGKSLNQEKINMLLEKKDIVVISGRYEGLDQRVIDRFVDEEISVGDYVLTSGDLPALTLIDSLIRQVDGVITKESYETDSFYNDLLGFPQYTRPEKLGRHVVPEVLLSGNHKKIKEYREQESIKKTILNRPDLLEKKMKDKDFIKKLKGVL